MNNPNNICYHGKYVITEKTPILFAWNTRHSDIIKTAESAGFFYVKTNPESFYGFDVICYGESESLDLSSNPDIDSKLITELLVGEFSHLILYKFFNNKKKQQI